MNSIRVNVRERSDRHHLQLAYTDPITGKIKTRSANTKDWDKAQRAAARWENELNNQQITNLSWNVFRRRFEDEHLATLSRNTRSNYMYGMNKFEKLVGEPRDISLINASLISQYTAKLRDDVDSSASVATNLNILRSVLGWAASMGMIAQVPKIRIPTIGTRGRPLSFFETLNVLRNFRNEHQSLTVLIKVMWLGGLRISEALKLRTDSGPVQVDFTGRRPAIAWSSSGQKSKRVERSPIMPDFARFLTQFNGPVVDCPLTQRTIKQKFQDLGNGFTSHDFRKTFGTRWALRIHPLRLKAVMRHKSLETTLKYYVSLDIDEVADEIWRDVHDNVHQARVPTRFLNPKDNNETGDSTLKGIMTDNNNHYE